MKYILGLILIFSLIACDRFEEPKEHKETYKILEQGGSYREPNLIIKTITVDGDNYTKRIFNCSKNTSRVLGSGSTLRKMKLSRSEAEDIDIIYRSRIYYLKRHACREYD
ncbi:hypothetical protein EKO29_10405 [Colwellia sp. Arc7-635]|uniref:hypothetical protein n=1 Tax=Colwellia sp. Arc7-635 TaxID=2497879 RepID=UPI000F84EC91|nr:hypothetical protein [Colwellia sp. Arc7-635]AZQ84393.1 hypothetical protein EKO29_10405 [Colwellia sp. Arc7-635]